MLTLELTDNASVSAVPAKTRLDRTGGCIVNGCGGSIKAKKMCSKHYQRWKKHGDPLVRDINGKYGSGNVNKKGYHVKGVGGKKVLIHREVAEAAIGIKLPKNAVVHHVDGDKLNNSASNLVVCQDEAYHRLLHVRMRAVKATGNPNHRKCCICKAWDQPENLKKNGSNYYHVLCKTEYTRKIKERKNAESTR